MSALTAAQDFEVTNALPGSYEDLASEYYDPVRHPTCANFREASDRLLDQWLREYPLSRSWICEVGSGRSAVAEQLMKRGVPLNGVTLVDSSATMLVYSKKWVTHGAHMVLGDSTALPLASASFDLIVSSLGDPYNESRFWREIYRVLRPGGNLLFTTPSYDWAVAFRSGAEETGIMAAEFEMSDGHCVSVPSLIYPINQQVRLIEAEGLRLDRVDRVSVRALTSQRLSSKLLIERGMEAEIVTGYVVTKPTEDKA